MLTGPLKNYLFNINVSGIYIILIVGAERIFRGPYRSIKKISFQHKPPWKQIWSESALNNSGLLSSIYPQAYYVTVCRSYSGKRQNDNRDPRTLQKVCFDLWEWSSNTNGESNSRVPHDTCYEVLEEGLIGHWTCPIGSLYAKPLGSQTPIFRRG